MGFRLFMSAGTRNPKRVQRKVHVDPGTNLMVGDAYKLNADGESVERAVLNSDTILGIVEGITFNPLPSVSSGLVAQDYIKDGDGGWIIGIEDEQALFEVEALTAADTVIGDFFELVDAAGSTTLRQSRQYVQADQGSNKQFVCDQVIDRTGNVSGSYRKIAVRLTTSLQSKEA